MLLPVPTVKVSTVEEPVLVIAPLEIVPLEIVPVKVAFLLVSKVTARSAVSPVPPEYNFNAPADLILNSPDVL